MTYYTTCPRCGANLDPDEKCDCEQEDNEDETTAIGGAGPHAGADRRGT